MLPLLPMLRLAIAVAAASPDTLRVRVERVLDGDTFLGRILDSARPEGARLRGDSLVSIRLAGIDAPEHGQPWGERSRAALSTLVGRDTVEVRVEDIDRYARVVGVVRRGSLEVNSRMVADGDAWMFRRYSRSPRLDSLERDARRNRLGLWSLPGAIEPSVWRRDHPRRNAKAAATSGRPHRLPPTRSENDK